MLGPRLLGQYPNPGETNVPTDAVVQLLFDRSLNEPSLRQGGIVLEARGQAIALQPRTAGSLAILGGLALLPSTTYRVNITTQLLDANGLALQQPVAYEFTTAAGPAASTLESVVQGLPFGTMAPTNARLVIRAARPLPSFAPLLFGQLVSAPSGSPAFLMAAASASLLDDRRTIVITPSDPLPAWSNVSIDVPALFDISGQNVTTGLSFSTSGDRDETPPRVLASTPARDASDVPPATAIRVQFSEAIGLMTPPDPARLLKGGERWPGLIALDGASVEFRPARALDPDSDCTLQLEGVADVAGNIMPPWSIDFHTAADSTPPGIFPRLVRSSLEVGDAAPLDPIELQFNLSLRAGLTNMTLNLQVTRPFDSPLAFRPSCPH